MQELDGSDGSTPFSHRRKGKDGRLLHRLNTAETRLALVIKLKNEAILAGYEDQETVRVLTNKLAAKEAEEGRLRSQLLDAQTEIGLLQERIDSQSEENSILSKVILEDTIRQRKTAEDLTFLSEENSHLRDENATLRLEVIKLKTRIDPLEGANASLAQENRDLGSSNNLLKSQVGSLYALHAPGLLYSAWRIASQLPFIGQFFDRAAKLAYDDFRQRKQPKKNS